MYAIRSYYGIKLLLEALWSKSDTINGKLVIGREVAQPTSKSSKTPPNSMKTGSHHVITSYSIHYTKLYDLNNVPNIRDVQTMRSLLESLGVEITEITPISWKINAKDINEARLDPSLLKQIRASILLAA